MSSSYERTFQLNVPSSTEHLALIRDFIGNVSSHAGFTEHETVRLTLAVDEAVANVIEHAYGSDTAKEVRIRVTVDEDQVEFLIIDTGKGFDPTAVQPKDIEQLIKERRSGGLGLRLIRTLMDDVQYHVTPGTKNELRMIKRIHKQ